MFLFTDEALTIGGQVVIAAFLAAFVLLLWNFMVGQYHGWRFGVALHHHDVRSAAHHLRWFNFEARCAYAAKLIQRRPEFEATMFRVSCMIHLMDGGSREAWLLSMRPHVPPYVVDKARRAVKGS